MNLPEEEIEIYHRKIQTPYQRKKCSLPEEKVGINHEKKLESTGERN